MSVAAPASASCCSVASIKSSSSSATLVSHTHATSLHNPPPNASRDPQSSDTAAMSASTVADPATQVSADFNTLNDQISTASHALATSRIPGDALAALTARLESIEQTQERLAEDLEVVRLQLGRVHQHGKERATAPEGGSTDELKNALEELKGKVDKLADTVKLDQQRLYVRLLNATVNVKKGAIKAPVTESGKPPPNFPATKGEYEHMTKERYELIMKAYGLPIKGDTTAKREALREFLGLAAFE